jgi:hypothetical protein
VEAKLPRQEALRAASRRARTRSDMCRQCFNLLDTCLGLELEEQQAECILLAESSSQSTEGDRPGSQAAIHLLGLQVNNSARKMEPEC